MRWHYTNGRRIDAIFASGKLKPAASCNSSRMRPAVWFSANAHWEATANRAVRRIDGSVLRCDREQTDLFCDGLFRVEIGASTMLASWREMAAMCGMQPGDRLKIESLARRLGSNPLQWYASLRSIDRDHWTAIERWNGGDWEPVEACAMSLAPSVATRLAG
ncbi:hypothetical protein [Blastopirellula marina]|nr:hypothetical protein [Blastopirellula marina]